MQSLQKVQESQVPLQEFKLTNRTVEENDEAKKKAVEVLEKAIEFLSPSSKEIIISYMVSKLSEDQTKNIRIKYKTIVDLLWAEETLDEEINKLKIKELTLESLMIKLIE